MSLKGVKESIERILDKNYRCDEFLTLKYGTNLNESTKIGIGFTHQIQTTPSFELKNTGFFSTKINKNNLFLHHNFRTSDSMTLKAGVDLDTRIKGMKCEVITSLNQAFVITLAKFRASLQREQIDLKSEIVKNGNATVLSNKFNASTGSEKRRLGFGFNFLYDLDEKNFALRRLVLFYKTGKLAALVQHEQDTQAVQGSLSYQLKDACHLAFRYVHRYTEKGSSIELGTKIDVNDKLAIQAKIDDKMNAQTSIAVKANSWLTFHLSSRMEATPTKEAGILLPVGFLIKIKQ